MNKRPSTILMSALILVTVVSMVSGLSAARKLRSTESELDRLEREIAAGQKKSSGPLASIKKPVRLSATEADAGRVAELEAELVTLRGQLAEARQEQRPPNREPRESWSDRMARMKEEEPERYAEMIKQREERRQQMRYDIAERTASFMGLNTEFMSESELENHKQLVDKMSAIWALSEKFQDPEYNPDRETMRQLFELTREARPLMDAERTVMFKQLGNELGMSSAEAEDLSAYIEQIIDTTTVRMPRGGDRGGPPGGARQ